MPRLTIGIRVRVRFNANIRIVLIADDIVVEIDIVVPGPQ
jgi:hypothetical protein